MPGAANVGTSRRRSVQLRGGIRGGSLTNIHSARGRVEALVSAAGGGSDRGFVLDDDRSVASRRTSVATVGTAEEEAHGGDTATPLPVPSFTVDRRGSRGDTLGNIVQLRQMRRLSVSAKRQRRFSDSAAITSLVQRHNPHIRRRRDSFYGLADGTEDQLRIGRIMLDMDRWNFNVVALDHVSDGTPLLHVACEVFERRGLYQALDLDKNTLQVFVSELEMGYLDNPFHNSVHAADVLQTTHVLLSTYEQYHPVAPDRVLALLVAAMIHDFKHPGVNNYFVRHGGHPMSEAYKGDSVLEQYHVAEAFGLMQRHECDVFACLPEPKARETKELCRRLVLATSLSGHFEFCQHVEQLLAIDDLDYSDPRMEETFLQLLLKTADVSYVALRVCAVWAFAGCTSDVQHRAGFPSGTAQSRLRSTSCGWTGFRRSASTRATRSASVGSGHPSTTTATAAPLRRPSCPLLPSSRRRCSASFAAWHPTRGTCSRRRCCPTNGSGSRRIGAPATRRLWTA